MVSDLLGQLVRFRVVQGHPKDRVKERPQEADRP